MKPCLNDRPNVFVVDDDPAVLASVEALLSAHGLSAHCFASAEEFLAEFPGDTPGCLITDLRLPGISGLELIRRLQDAGSPLSVILVTGTSLLSTGNPSLPVNSPSPSDLTILEKPYVASDLIRLIRHSLTQSL
jgi:two-component system, LuxR family, response regulator FixJ